MDSCKRFDDLVARLHELLLEGEVIMTSEKRAPSMLKSVISSLNSVYSELERLSLQEQNEEKRKGLMETMQKQHAAKTVFDESATAWLQRTGIEKAASIVSAPRTLRSNIARSSSQLKSKGMRSNSTSTSSSFSSAKVVAKEEVARLRLKQLQEKHELERKQEEIKRQQEIVNLTHELQEASLERQVLEEELDRGGYIPAEESSEQLALRSTSKPARVVSEPLVIGPAISNAHANVSLYEQNRASKFVSPASAALTNIPPAVDNPQLSNDRFPNDCFGTLNSSSNLGAVAQMMHDAARKPNLEMTKFNGNPMMYSRFISTFEATIEAIEHDVKRRLLYLIQHCGDKVKPLIEYCLLLEPTVGFRKAKTILHETFGRKNVIARAYIKSLINGPVLKQENSEALLAFAQSIEECYTTLNHLGYQSNLNSFENILKIVRRLPYNMQNRWLRRSSEIERKGLEAGFEDLKEFICSEAEVSKSSYASALKVKGTTSSKNFSTSTTVRPNQVKCCPLCKSKHVLWDCSVFTKKSVEDRIVFMRQNRLCDNCAKRGHISKFCFSPPACTVANCTHKHHSLLHKEVKASFTLENAAVAPSNDQSAANVSSFTGISANSDDFYLNVVPVRVSSSTRSINTYAFLDQGSTSSLCDQRLLKWLNVSGDDVTFSITTLNGKTDSCKGRRVALTLSSMDGSESLYIDDMLSVDSLPVSANPRLSAVDFKRWPHFKGVPLTHLYSDVTILIGVNVPKAFWVREERRGLDDEPYALRTVLGWSLVGPRRQDCQTVRTAFITANVNFISTDKQIERLWQLDQVPRSFESSIATSKEDRYALQLMQRSKDVVDSHYQFALPWKPGAPQLPDNYSQAAVRQSYLKRRLEKDAVLKQKYVSTLNSYMSNGHAQLTPACELTKSGWYLPHHPVFHPHKPDKVRVVFDCAAQYDNCSLNKQLLKGPDFLNSLVGVLTRFRMEKVAVVGDIEQMFHQVLVDPKDRQYLRFLWWPDGDTSQRAVTHHMNVHLFGATSSPSCAQFALRQAVKDQPLYDDAIKRIIERNFYMDDCLFSAPTTEEAIRLANGVSRLLGNRGFRLRKWISNEDRVLSNLADENHVIPLPVKPQDVATNRILGVLWDVVQDSFCFAVDLSHKPFTKRGILSTLSSIFDPLGFVAPVILTARLLFQDLSRRKFDWDEPLLENDSALWQGWLNEVSKLSSVVIHRPLIQPTLQYDALVQRELHHFCDASSQGYCSVSYLRIVSAEGTISCNFLFGKSRLAPLKSTSIPKLELVAATMSSCMDKMLRLELEGTVTTSVFWTDSLAVLHMIRNTHKRFPVFVANRLAQIEQNSSPDQWRFVSGKDNPADTGTRPCTPEGLQSNWFSGPPFLWLPPINWPEPPCLFPSLPEEFKCKQRHVFAAVTNTFTLTAEDSLDKRFSRFSSWYKLKKAVAHILRLRCKLLHHDFISGTLTATELVRAETAIIIAIQKEFFSPEIALLQSGKQVSKGPLRKLNPIFISGILRVGGRIQNSTVDEDAKHPVILPSCSHVTKLLIEHHHVVVGHCGMSYTWTSLRQKYWVIKGAATVRKILGQCLYCKRRNCSFSTQFMADLPSSRVADCRPCFYFTGVDFFGPFFTRVGRSKVKRYGCIFTCLSVRAVHLEMAFSLSTDAFVNVLRRFICRRGKPHTIHCDNGTNFIGASAELRRSMMDLNNSFVQETLRRREIEWSFIPPQAPHMGGAWERIIRTIKRILNALLLQQTLTDDSLITVLTEVESIINSRPLTPVVMDPSADEPLTPNHLLLARSPQDSSSIGVFTKKDNYTRKKWRQVQYVVDQFWLRWRKEYLQTLQARQKWTKIQPNLAVDDLVLVNDQAFPRGKWPMGKVIQTFPDKSGHVRQVLVRTQSNTLLRPVTKLCKFLPE